MLCVVVIGPTNEEVSEQIEIARLHADVIELRLDYFKNVDFEALGQLRRKFSIPMIFTMRKEENEDEEERKKILFSLAALQPEYFDLDLLDPIEEISKRWPGIQYILSYHNFVETPLHLDQIYGLMCEKPAAFYKMAVWAQHSVDLVRFLAWSKMRTHPFIGISMGSYGQPSRLLAPCMGSALNYIALDEEHKTAPGQFTLREYRPFHGFRKFYGLIGDPVSQSPSDTTHNDLMKKLGLEAVYVKMQLREEELAAFLQYAKELFSGLSVTMPLKERILPFVDEIDQEASMIGAINTLSFREGKIFGYNTDGIGALDALEQQSSVLGKRIVIIGAGGSARAIAYEAKKRGAEVILTTRNEERGQLVARALDVNVQKKVDRYDILINATPIAFPIEPEEILPGTLVMDIKSYEDAMLLYARSKGCLVVHGYEMFREQALAQFALWFGESFDKERARELFGTI